MKWLLIIVIIVAAPILIMYLIGYFMPVQHTSSHTVVLTAPPEQIWKILQDHRQYITWRSDVKKIEVKDPLHWIETTTNGTLSFESEIVKPGATFRSRIVNQNLPFGGSWTYELIPDNGATKLTITEHGEVYNPIFRFMSKYVFGHEATLKKFSADLAKKINAK